MNLLFRISTYIRHLITAGDEHSIHSPFLFSLYQNCINTNSSFYCFKQIEVIRKRLLNNQRIIQVHDFGAGSSTGQSADRKISTIAKNSLKSAKLAQAIFRLTKEIKPQHIIELGTSLGITTTYLASVDPSVKVTTFEGCPTIAFEAKKNFIELGLKNIKVVEGNIDLKLEDEINNLEKVDVVFFDANHRYEPTLKYYETCLSKAHKDSLFIFDDIYWNAEMNKAWKEIIARPEVMVSVDLYEIGLVFFRKNAPKQHFQLKI